MHKKKMAIICSTDFQTFPMGGMMSFILDTILYLKEEYDITFWGVTENKQVDNFIIIGEDKFEFKTFSKIKTKNKIIPNFLKVIWGVFLNKNKILKEDYDVLYIHGIPLSFPFFNKKVKVINHIHGMTNPFAMTPNRIVRTKLAISLYEKYRNWIVKKSDLIFLASDIKGHKEFSNRFIGHKNKIIYTPNFADTDIFINSDKSKARRKLSIDREKTFIVNTGRISLQKDPILLIHSFAYLLNELKFKANLVIIGDGELMNDVKKLITKYNISKNVLLLGKLKREEINLWLNSADLYLYTSHANGFPISLAESAACSLPIVTTDVTGVHDLVVNGKTGYLIEGRSPKDIALKAVEALSKKEEFSENILEISKTISSKVVISKMIKEINLVLD